MNRKRTLITALVIFLLIHINICGLELQLLKLQETEDGEFKTHIIYKYVFVTRKRVPRLVVVDEYAYIMHRHLDKDAIHIINIKTKKMAAEEFHLDGHYGISVFKKNIILAGSKGIAILDISNPEKPGIIDDLKIDKEIFLINDYGFKIYNEQLFLIGQNRILIYSLSNNRISFKQEIDLGQFSGMIQNFVITDKHLLVCKGDNLISYFFDKQYIFSSILNTGYINEITLHEEMIFFITKNKLSIFSPQNNKLTKVSTLVINDIFINKFIFHNDSLLILHPESVSIVNIKNPLAPVFVDRIPIKEKIRPILRLIFDYKDDIFMVNEAQIYYTSFSNLLKEPEIKNIDHVFDKEDQDILFSKYIENDEVYILSYIWESR